VASAGKGTSQLIMPQRLQVIPLDVLLSAAQNSKNGHRMAAASQKSTPEAERRSRRKVAAPTNGTGKKGRQATTEDKPQKVIQPITALLYQSALAMEQEQAEAKQLQKAKPQQIIQPVTALQFMAALAKQLEQAEANQQKQPVAKQSSTNQQKQPAITQQEQSAVKPVRKRKPAVRKPPVQPAPVIAQAPPPQVPPAKPTRKRKPAVRKPVVQPPPVTTQVPPIQRPSPVWVWCLRGIGTVGSVLLRQYGGEGGIIAILLLLLPQAALAFLIVALLIVFPVRFPNVPFGLLLLGSGVCLVVYIFLAYVHCEVEKETDKAPSSPIIALYILYPLFAFLFCKVFLS
jgi:hypothetical protein